MIGSALQIGETAAQASVSVDTVRYYEKLGLLAPAYRTSAGYRFFSPETVERIKFIKQAQELGFSLDEIKDLLIVGGAEECQKVHDLLKVKLGELDQRIRSMRVFRKKLAEHLENCEDELGNHGMDASCPVLIDATQL